MSKSIVKFEQVGYAKYPNNMRIKTFNVIFTSSLSKQEKLDLIYQHGKNQQQTPGRMSQSYYYLNGSAPYIDQSLSTNQIDSILLINIDEYEVRGKFDYSVCKFPNSNIEPSFQDSNFRNPYEVK